MQTHGSAAVSNVLNPAPTTNMLPQKPPKLCFTPLGQNNRHPTHSVQSPHMNVTLNPQRFRIYPEMVKGQRKYAPKYALARPADSAFVILRRVTKLLLSTSSRP
jgi:hypothetical protein